MKWIERALMNLSVAGFSYNEHPLTVGQMNLCPQLDRQYVLRMIVGEELGKFFLPSELEWVRCLVEKAYAIQSRFSLPHRFCYVTVRHGEVTSTTDDEWHVDGFSMRNHHIPDQNYIWCDSFPTEWLCQSISIPNDFDPLRHNLHKYIASVADENNAVSLSEKVLYAFDTYCIHRRPKVPEGTHRTFVRVSFCAIEIDDVNNTDNPLIPRKYTRDGVKEFRDTLVSY